MKVAPLESNILITGQSGSGKELVANVIHFQSNRNKGPLVRIDCAVCDEEVLETELFGCESMSKGGDGSQHFHKLELGHRGSVLLDEVGDIPVKIQGSLLRIAEKKRLVAPGQREFIGLDVRIIATTNKSLKDLIDQGRFREDLYHRLNVICVHVPALKDRIEDLPLLISYLLKRVNMKVGSHFSSISKQGLQMLTFYNWPGNVRELENILERAALFGEGNVLRETDIRTAFRGFRASSKDEDDRKEFVLVEDGSLKETLQRMERDIIVRALLRANGVQTEAARILGLGPKNLWKKIQKHSIEVQRFSESRNR